MIWVDVYNEHGELIASTPEFECADPFWLTLSVKQYGKVIFEAEVEE